MLVGNGLDRSQYDEIDIHQRLCGTVKTVPYNYTDERKHLPNGGGQ